MSEHLRIIQYITPSQIGGAEVHASVLSEKLQERGHEVLVICPHGRPLATELLRRGLRIKTPRTTGKFDPLMLWRLVKWLRCERAQVIHTHLSTASLLGGAAARLVRVPAVATVHGLNSRTCFTSAHAIIAVSRAVKQHLVSQGMPEERITVIHNGVDLQTLPGTGEGLLIRREWGIPEDAPLLVTVGRLTPSKGHRDLLAALVLLVKTVRWQDLHLLIVGEGGLRSDLEREAKQFSLSGNIIFAGFQRNVLPFVKAADIFVLPSIQEGLSLSALEAMALGKPVVACRVGGTPEVVVDGQTGILVSPGNPRELANALEQLLEKPEKANVMGEAGRRRVAEAFDLEQMVTKIESVYRDLIARFHPAQNL